MGAVATSPPSPLTPGYYLDRYELLCPLAEGGMASVWLARLAGKHGFEKHVAIKTILPQFASDDRFRTMFLDEARIASRIEHTNVVQILDLGEQHEILYLVMEYVDSDSLSRLFRTLSRKNVPLPHNVLLRIIADASGGLHAAHELAGPDGRSLGVVHRDVSPQNILISTLGVSKLIDFGVAKARDRAGSDTSSGLVKGKINYMAPEQATGGDVDRRTDVFAMGTILYHLLSGKPPFEGDTQLNTLHKLVSNEPAAPLPKSVHPAITAVVMRALARHRADRYASAADLQLAIEGAMVGAGLSCSVAEVSRFIKEHMAERTAKRKEAIDLAFAAAAERQRTREKLRVSMSEPPGAESASGVGVTDRAALRALNETSSPGGTASSSGVIEVEVVEPKKSRFIALLVALVIVSTVAVVLLLQSLLSHPAPTPAPAHVVMQPVATAPLVPKATVEATTTDPPPALDVVDINDLPRATVGAPAREAFPPPPSASNKATPAESSARHRENYGF